MGEHRHKRERPIGPPPDASLDYQGQPGHDASLDYDGGFLEPERAGFESRPATPRAPEEPTDGEETLLLDGRSWGGRSAVDPAEEEPVIAPDAGPVDAGPVPDPQRHAPTPAGFRGLLTALRGRRAGPAQVVIAVLCGLLGFFAVVQVRLQADDDNFRTARQTDLIRILDDLNDRSERLTSEIRDLENRRDELRSGSDRSKAALTEAEQRRAVLGILAGTVAARGPGIVLRIEDPQQKVDAAVLLDTLQELRDAGAEAVQINEVRVVASTDFLDSEPGSVRIDGRVVAAPYVFKVIGDPDTLDPALRIPGGVFAVLDDRGATPTVDTRKQISVDATRPATDLDYARITDPEQ